MPVHVSTREAFEYEIPVVVVGGGACGLTAALSARDAGADVLVIERDDSLYGTTGMSTGLIPAADTPEQRARGIEDTAKMFAQDVMRKSKGGADEVIVNTLTGSSATTVAWLRETHDVPLSLLDGFTYPGHSVMRMYGTPRRSGAELIACLEAAVGRAGADVLTQAVVEDIHVDSDGIVLGVTVRRPDGAEENIGCQALVLACCGFAGNPALVDRYIPEISAGVFHGHPGNKGHAIEWGRALGAALADMDAYQGHAGLAAGHGIPILWPLIAEGGFQVNRNGVRFSDESRGYSEQAVDVLRQPDHVAYSIFDQRLYELMMQFEDFRDAVEAGAIVRADSVETLAQRIKVPETALRVTFENERAYKCGSQSCPFGRVFSGNAVLEAPFHAARVTGALFHTQGGLAVDECARVIRQSGGVFKNLFAGGGAARGISGSGAAGYIAGNGLLTATGLGRIGGQSAAELALS